LTSILSKDISSKNITRADFLDFSENLITSREQAVLKLIVEGFTNQEIAETLHISVRTVDTHRANMLAKLNLTNTASLVRFAIENKLV
jgi:DNA-binding NarL/FixJ family response regulator